MRRWLTLVAVLLGCLVALNLLAYRHAGALLQFKPAGQRTEAPERLSFAGKLRVLLLGVHVPRPAGGRSPEALDSSCRSLSIDGPERISLAAWYCPAGEASPLVILFHGYSADKSSLVSEARLFLELGASVLLVDFRGSGGSSESYTTLGVLEAQDVHAVVEHVRRHFPGGPLVLFGQSMGAAAILRAAHVHGVAPDGVILEAVFDTLLNAVGNRFRAMGLPAFPGAELLVYWGGRRWHLDAFEHKPVDYAASLRAPTLLLHGARDQRATLAQARRVFAALPGPKVMHVLEAAGHGSYAARHPLQWRAPMAPFLGGLRSRPER